MSNPTTRREHAGAAKAAVLTAFIGAADATFTISDATGWPTGAVGSFFVVIDPGQFNEEKVLCSALAATTLTVAASGRGADGTSARTHSVNAACYPIWAAAEADELNLHAASTTAVHGVAGAVVGTTDAQTLTNKAISESQITGLVADLAAITSANPFGSSGAGGQVFIAASATTGTKVNAAMTSLSAVGGGTIILGPGNHTLDVAIQISTTVEIKGTGQLATVLIWDTATFPTAIKMVDTTNRRVQLRNFLMICSNPGAGLGIDAGYFQNSILDNLFIGNSANGPLTCIDFSQNGGSANYYNLVSNCFLTCRGASPVCVIYGNASNSQVMFNCRVIANVLSGTGSGIQTVGTACSNLHLEHIDMESNAINAFDIGATAIDVMILEPYVEGCTIGVKIAAGAKFTKVIGGKIQSNTSADISDAGTATAIWQTRTSASDLATGYRNNPTGAAIVFTASGTLTAAQVQGAYALRVRCVGAGGGGGACVTPGATTASHGGGGGGGSYAESVLPMSGITFPVTITVGPTVASAAAGNNAGTNGTASSFAATVIGSGGNGGGAGQAVAVGNVSAGGSTNPAASTGQITMDGQPGQPGVVVGLTALTGGAGGNSGMGGAGAYGNTGTADNAGRNPASNQGGGGGGGTAVASGTQRQGGQGASGLVIVEPLFG